MTDATATDSTATPVQQMDQIRRAYDAKSISLNEAVAAIQSVTTVTRVGAVDLLEDKRMPSARYDDGTLPRQGRW